MNRKSKTPFIPPLKLSASEDAVLRCRPQNVRHAPDDLPDPQAGGESARRQRTEDSVADKDEPHGKPTAPGQLKELHVPKTAKTEECAAADHRYRGKLEQSPRKGNENVQEAMSKTTSKVRKLISLFDRNACTSIGTNELSPRCTHVPDLGETAICSKEMHNASGGKITPLDNSDADPSLPDANDYTDVSISTLLQGKEEETKQYTRTHTRWLQQIEQNKMSVESWQPSVTITHQRNRSAGQKSRLSLVENLSREQMPCSNTRTDDFRGFKSNALIPVRNVAPDETRKVTKRSRLPVFKSESKALKNLTVGEAFTGSKRTNHADFIPRQGPPTNSTKIRARWDGSPPKHRTSIGASGESIRCSSRSRTCRKMIKDVTHLATDEALELSCTVQPPERQDPVANFVLHDPALQPPCRLTTNRLVFEPREMAIRVENHLSHHHFSNWYSIIVKLNHGLSCFLSLLWAVSAKVFILVMAAAYWIAYPVCRPLVLQWIRVPGSSRHCPLPSSPRQLSQVNAENQTGIWNRFRTSFHRKKKLIIGGVILLAVFLCCLQLLVLDCCQTE